MAYSMLINGEMIASEKTFPVLNPSTENIITHAPDCTQEQLETAVRAAKHALISWGIDCGARRAVLEECAGIIRANVEILARILSEEQGKTLVAATGEVMGSAAWFSYTAGLEIPVEIIKDDELARVEVHRKPVGVVAGIVPWNYPLMLAAWKIAPALLAGNTALIKPSPYTPLTTLKFADLIKDIVPAGVLNILSGGDELGKWMTAHPVIRKISFTGSSKAGRHVALAAANDFKRVTLELGGNDPAIVFPGVDVKAIAQKLYDKSFDNSAQICAAIKRIYLHESIYDDILTEMVSIAQKAKVGNGLDPEVTMGPINNLMQFERVQMLVNDAKEHCGKIATGGNRIGTVGYFYEPTIVTGLSDDSRLVAEEQFGPVIPVLSFADEATVIDRANNTNFGLSASVWTGNEEQARRVAPQLQVGTVWINQHLSIIPQAPLCGVKESGVGVENGPWGLYSFTDIQTLSFSKV